MTTDEWVAAGLAVLAGLLAGAVLGWLVRRVLSSVQREAWRHVARPTGLFLFWFFVALGVVVAVGIVSPGSLDDIPRQILEFLPRVLAGGLILLAGYAISIALGRLTARSLGAATGAGGERVGAVIRFVILAAAAILALAQLGVDVTILTVLVAAVAFGTAGAAALMIGNGGSDLVSKVASGRYVRRKLHVGDAVSFGAVAGTVTSLDEATVALDIGQGRTGHYPYSALLDRGFVVTKRAQDDDGVPTG